MTDYVLETTQLTKIYGTLTALNKVNIRLERGRIYGFVGNNGAGKTTLMRIVTGLVRPTSGKVRLFGADSEAENVKNRRKIGVIVEQPVFYGDMTARQNLVAQSIIQGKTEKAQINRLLEIVGLSHAEKMRLRSYSTGMIQRFGIAFALLGNPELLILDEPFNGLDVEGMDEMTMVLKNLCEEEGTTIFLSSHLLARLYQLATDYIFINRGQIIKEITTAELDDQWKSRDTRDLENYFRELVRSDNSYLKKEGGEGA
ncbi:MAG: ATP-binding cassette domain-containing protein [Clostridiales bacterium]|jgi:ABC-2 type transport system ATP-binding protein|nr:ATP-binding cassette domain-containing protein [Clostridiales bacterium]